MDRVTMVDRANEAAADVFEQWKGVDIDWTSHETVRRELDAHWGDEPANLDAEWTGSDEENYRECTASALRRMRIDRTRGWAIDASFPNGRPF